MLKGYAVGVRVFILYASFIIYASLEAKPL